MNKLFIMLIICTLAGCSTFRPSWVNENSFEIKQNNGKNLPGHFDKDGNYIPENPDIEWTYKIPDISAGFTFDIASAIDNKWEKFSSPCLQIEIVEFDLAYINTLKLDFGVAYQRTFLYLGKLWTNIFEISTGVYAGWDYERRKPCYGIAATIIKF